MKFSQESAEGSPFRAREFIAGKDAQTLATDIMALDQEQFSAAFRNSPMKRAKLAGLRRNAELVLRSAENSAATHVLLPESSFASPKSTAALESQLTVEPEEVARTPAP